MKALERVTKESSQGPDQTCPVCPGQTTATGWSTGSLLLFKPDNFPKTTMYKTDLLYQYTADKSVCMKLDELTGIKANI